MRLFAALAITAAVIASPACAKAEPTTPIRWPGAVIHGATICEDTLPFADCYTAKADLPAYVVSIDGVDNVRVVIDGQRYVTGPDETYVLGADKGRDVTVRRFMTIRANTPRR